MYDELASLVIDYNHHCKLMDELSVREIEAKVKEHLPELSPYLQRVELSYEISNRKKLADYDYETKKIILYFAKIQNWLEKKYGPYNIRNKNLALLRIFLHEMNHAEQNYISSSDREDIESILIRLSLELLEENFYQRNYKLFPTERLAEIDTFVGMLQITQKTGIEDNLIYWKELIKRLYQGYGRIFPSSPVETFINRYNPNLYFRFSKKKLEEIKENYSLEERLRLGLPINRTELKTPLDEPLLLQRLKKTRP